MMKDKFLSSLGASQGRRPLDFFKKLNQASEDAFKAYTTVHVAGTNGKGSVCLKIAKALELSGKKVGLYTSPHIFDIDERIQVNGERIAQDELDGLIEELISLVKGEMPTFFEAMTWIAFQHFKRKKVDIAVIETGIGGKLDATNIIMPVLTVVTSIGYDHMAVLGSTLEAIAEEKAGIIKPRIPLILGPTCLQEAFYKEAKRQLAPITTIKGTFFSYDEENSAVAKAALLELAKQMPINRFAIEDGISYRPAFRMQLQGNVLFDVAHNETGMDYLFKSIKRFFPSKKLVVLAGFSKDKKIESCLKIFYEKAEFTALIQTSSKKTMTFEELALLSYPYRDKIHAFSNGAFALEQLLDYYEKDNYLIVVTGSFYIMKKAFSFFKEKGLVCTTCPSRAT